MTISEQGAVSHAVARADVAWLSAYFDGVPCPIPVLRGLVAHEDPTLRYLGVVLLRERVGRPGGGADREAAALLPHVSAGSPEAALVSAQVYARLRVPVPQWRAAGWPAPVRIAWLRAEIVARPEATLRAEPAGEELYRAVEGIDAGAVDDVGALLDGLSARPDSVLRAAALRVVRRALADALIGPGQARARLVELLDPAAGTEVVAGALAELAAPWAAEEIPAGMERALRRLLPEFPDAVEVAARFGTIGLLREVAADPGLPGRQRQRALAAIGDVAERGDVGALLVIAEADPLLFAESIVACLGAMHRRGHFVRDEDVPAVIAMALADHRVAAVDVAIVLYTVRHEALRVLISVADDHPDWPRCVELLSALSAQGAPDLPVGEVLAARLAGVGRPEPVLAALRALRYTGAEEGVLAALPRAPRAALRALEAIGGPRTVAVLREGLGVADQGGVVVPHLRGVTDLALEVLWHLTDDPHRRRELRARLDRRALPERIAVDLGMPDPDELALLTADIDADRPVAALCRIARNGDARTIPALADLLLRVVSDLVANRGEEAAEPVVPDEVVEAIGALGERLYRRRVLRPVCLLGASDPKAARAELLCDITLDLIDREGVTDAELAVLLELLSRGHEATGFGTRRSEPGVKDRIHHLIRHRDPDVRKHAISLIARDPDAARSLSASLIALTTSPDPRTVRQALRALGRMRARWAGEAIAACLGHPVMNVRKTAAEALIDAGTPRRIPVLLGWLGRHDNPGLRESLTAALGEVLGPAYRARVLAAAERATNARERALLIRALDREWSTRAVAALVRRGSVVAEPLLAGLARGDFTVRDGGIPDLAEEFAAHGIAVPKPAAEASEEDRELRADLLTMTRRTRPDHDVPAVLRLVRRGPQASTPEQHGALREALPQLLVLARWRPADRAAVLRFVVAACPAPWSDAERAAFADAYDVLAAEFGTVDGVGAILEAVASTLAEIAAFDLARRIRALPDPLFAGPTPLAVLRCCGAVRTREDVERALVGARSGPNPWEAEVAVLGEAFRPEGRGDASGSEAEDPERVALPDAWRSGLDDAVRSPRTLAAFRAATEVGAGAGCGAEGEAAAEPDSRARIVALIDVFPSAEPDTRVPLLDWLSELQPIDAPPWVSAERAARARRFDRTRPAARLPRAEDLDQPRSTPQRERLVALLAAADPRRRRAAAEILCDWAEPATRRVVLDAHLRGAVDLPAHLLRPLAPTLLDLADDPDPAGVFARPDADPSRARAARLCAIMDPEHLERAAPHLVSWWEHGTPTARAAVLTAGRAMSADVLAEALRTRLDAGAPGCLDLLLDRTMRRTPELTETVRRLRVEGRKALADRLTLVGGVLRAPGPDRNGLALVSLRARTVPPGAERPTRDELIATVRAHAPEQARRAMSRLADEHGADPEVHALVVELLGHAHPRVRLHAHRISRRVLDRAEYLRHTQQLLDDPRRDVVRGAIRTLSHAGWQPAVPSLITLFADADPVIREAAGEGLARIGVAVLPALRKAAAHARPDRRGRYLELRDRIAAAPE
ncbi:HEAT repeat domain-containing protein [Embleya sp. NPDC056575]|uniref:HEAT repeat domain-containing protein n=1 Tax=unclassified Embleya TaxID=2699296 RepID=UPI0036C3B4FD